MDNALETVSSTADGGQVRRARRALALAGIDGDTEAAVALVFERLHFTEAHGDRQARTDADAGFRRGRATLAREGQGLFDDALEVRLLHVRMLASWRCVAASYPGNRRPRPRVT